VKWVFGLIIVRRLTSARWNRAPTHTLKQIYTPASFLACWVSTFSSSSRALSSSSPCSLQLTRVVYFLVISVIRRSALPRDAILP
jgi:hypothetical protein